MKLLTRLFCLLLSFILLLPLLFVGVSAKTIDGYNIVSSWWPERAEDYLEFDNVIISSFEYDSFIVQYFIHFERIIQSKTLFNIDLNFNISSFLSIDLLNFQILGQNNVVIDNIDTELNFGVISVEELQYKEDVIGIRVQFLVNKPIWTKEAVEETIFINGTSYKFQVGMTWSEWILSNYNTLGLFSENGFIYGNNVILKLNGESVHSLDYISEDMYYSLHTIGNVSTTLDFYIDGIKYHCLSGQTWLDWVESDYNIDRFFAYSNEGEVEIYDERILSIDDNTVCYSDGWQEFNVKFDDIIDPEISYYTTLIEYWALFNYSFDFSITSITITELDEMSVIQSILSGIKEIPSKVGEVFISGIQKVFIPDQEKILEIKDKFVKLLSDRFGFAYESIAVTDNIVSAFTYQETKSIIEIPVVSVNLAGSVFTFGGWEVRIIPEGFEDVAETCKMILNVVLTCVFLNGARKRIFEVIGDGR